MPTEDLSQYLAYLLASAHRHMREGISRSIGQGDFTEEHWRILHVLSNEEGFSMGDLAELVLMNGPALTKNIDRLVSHGMVQRAADADDNRKVLVFITDRGLQIMRQLSKRIDAHHDRVEVNLGPQKTKQLKKLLASFVNNSGP